LCSTHTAVCGQVSLNKALGDLSYSKANRQVRAANKLTRVLEDIRDVRPELDRMVMSKSAAVRLAAIRTIWALEGPTDKYLPTLIETLRSKNAEHRVESVGLIGKLGTAAESAVPLLIGALKDGDSDVRIGAAVALGRIGPPAHSAVTTLVPMMTDETAHSVVCFPIHVTAGKAAGYALREIGSASVPAVASLLQHEDLDVRTRAIWVLANGG